MSWSIVLVLGGCVLAAHSAAVHGIKDATHNRIARSPHYGSSYHHDDIDQPPPSGPPPPPIVYHTQNWSGVSKGIGGTAQGVFSGAAASAQSAVPAVSEAFSLAASGTGPVTSNDGGQLKEKLGKSGLGATKISGSLGNRFGGSSNSYGSSSDGQYNIQLPGLELNGDASGCGSEESDSQSGQYNAGTTGFNSKLAGGISSGYRSSYDQANFDRQSGQRSINSGFGRDRPVYGRQNGQYGSYEAFGETGSGRKFGSDSWTDAKAVGNMATDFGSESGQTKLPSFGQSGTDGFAGAGSAGSANNFDQYKRQSGSGYRARGGERSYGVGREYESHGGYGGHDFNHHDDFHRHGKSHHGNHRFDENDDGIYYQGNSFGENEQSRGIGFANSQSSSFGSSNKRNFGSHSSGFGEDYSGKQGEIDSANQASTQDISGAQQVKQLDAGLSASQTSQSLSLGQTQSAPGSSGFDYNKSSGSLIADNKGALLAGKANVDIPAEVPLSAGVSGSAQEDVQSTLGGALNLASQGLQTAQNTPCATCNKGSYALSNAKSHSGSAIALSIGG